MRNLDPFCEWEPWPGGVNTDRTRRAVLAAALTGGIGWLATSSRSSFPRRFAPLSGTAWRTANDDVPGRVDSPYGDATVEYDDEGVPHVTADDERSLYFAVGYVHAADRLFQMDLLGRLFGGRLSAAVGEAAVDSDVFHRKLQFERAARVTWRGIEGTDTGDVVEAYADGVEAYRSENELPLEFRLLEYEPLEWTPTETLLMEKQISWGLTGGFRTLRRAVLREALGQDAVERLYPRIMDHDSPILRDGSDRDDDSDAARTPGTASERSADGPSGPGRVDDAAVPDPAVVAWLSQFEWPDGVGSNSWAVGSEYTDSGTPILCNDPHLRLTAPPVWYEQRTVLEGENGYDARGVTFPGVPLVIIGENHDGAWGYTNAGADVIDFYAYDRGSGETYAYGDSERKFDVRTEIVAVDGGEDVPVTVRTSVHGPVVGVGSGGDPLPGLDDAEPVGVAWTGFSSTRTTEAIHDLIRSTGVEEAREAVRRFDEPTQNLVYVDDENVLYYLVGAIPIRRTHGEPVTGTRVFDGSAREGEWPGYRPFGDTDWNGEGFVPFEAKPHVENPGYVATANQRIVDDPEYYFSEGYAPPFRGARIYERLDGRAETDQPFDVEFVADVQQDVYDRRAGLFLPVIAAAADRLSGDARDATEAVFDWDLRMTADSRGALVFRYWLEAFREETFGDEFRARNIEDLDYPNDFVLGNLPSDSRWFAPAGESDGDRDAVAARAMEIAIERIDEAGHEVYGDYNRTAIDHPFDQSFLNYPRLPTDGSPTTVRNFRKDGSTGSSWRMIARVDGDSRGIVPGGNSGNYFSDHYNDQLDLWANEGYKPLVHRAPETPELVIRFRSEASERPEGGSG